MKIVYCINSIRVLGGIERVTVVKANALAEVPGNEVYIAVLTDKKGCYTEVPSPKVKVVDLTLTQRCMIHFNELLIQ